MVGIKCEEVWLRYPVYCAPVLTPSDRVRNVGGKILVESLRGVSVSIQAGERVGLIGANGAGKSSLLRVLAGTFPVDSGRVVIRGRRLALLEVTAGLMPDRTAAQNARFVGRLLGLRQPEIERLVEDAIDFADLGPSAELPLRTYSTGMVVRLAFGIYSGVPHDILLLDEMIGAGDAHFAAKARARIDRLVEGASIVVLATHAANALLSYCTRALVLNEGQIVADAPPAEAWELYAASRAA